MSFLYISLSVVVNRRKEIFVEDMHGVLVFRDHHLKGFIFIISVLCV